VNDEEFRRRYKDAVNWGEGEDLLRELSKEDLTEFIYVHQRVDEMTGLDMRQQWYLQEAKVLRERMIC